MKRAIAVVEMVACLAALRGGAQERGTPIFSDTFETTATFAENWVPRDKRVRPEAGRVVFPGGGTLVMRAETPAEFVAEMEITVDLAPGLDAEKARQGFCGFTIEGFRFLVLPTGSTWMIYQLKGQERAHGKNVAIDGFERGKPVRLELSRRIANGVATYAYRVNGKDAGSFVYDAPVAPPGLDGRPQPFKPLEIGSYNVAMTLEAFALFAVKKGENESPNVIINSSFEQEQEGFPLYYCRSGFNLAKALEVPYEDFLATWSLDTAEKHSGRQSLKMMVNQSMGGQTLWAWGAGTVKDLPGVFSVWLKADQEKFPVTISYGKRKEVLVGTSWQRYEVVNPKLPGVSVYSPVTISATKADGTLWVDDLQAEFLPVPEPDPLGAAAPAFRDDATYATPYRPSALDAQRFGQSEPPVRAAEIVIPKLPAGVAPQGDLDGWKEHAVRLDSFYFKQAAARNRTEAYLACDDTNLYLGYRCTVADLAAVTAKAGPHDSFSVFSSDSVEFFLDPAADGGYFQFATDAAGTRVDIGRGGDVAWHGAWTSTARRNEAAVSIDYEIVVPFATVASAGMGERWLVNICRSDAIVKEHLSVARTPVLGFKQTAYWPFARLPREVVARYAVGAVSGSYAEGAAGVTVALSIANNSGREVAVRAELADAQNTQEAAASTDLTLRPGVNDVTFAIKEKADRVVLRLTADGKPLAAQTVALEKRNPLAMLGRLSYYMNEPEAAFRVEVNVAGVEAMTALLSVAGQSVRRPAAAAFTIAVPLAGVPEGGHAAKLTLLRGEEKVAETTAPLIKRPHRVGAAQVNQFTRSVMHDGKPVFPFSPFFVFAKHQKREYVVGGVDLADRYGFRTIHILIDNRAMDQAMWVLERAQEKGMLVHLWTKQDGLSDEEGAAFRAKFDLPNVFAQMVMDEPELGVPSDVARDFLRKMRAVYPYHPVHMNNTVLGIPNRYAGLETDILMLDDYLTNREKRTVASVVDAVDHMWRAGREEGKPCYYFVVGGNFPLHHREPSFAEQVAQTYGCIAAGCTGLSYFYGVPATPGNWRAYIQLNREIRALADVLLSEEAVDSVRASADPRTLRLLTKRHGGAVYVVACNIDEKPMGEVTFSLPAGLAATGDAEVLFEDRRVPLAGGAFRDPFDGHTRHVYRVEVKKPDKKE